MLFTFVFESNCRTDRVETNVQTCILFPIYYLNAHNNDRKASALMLLLYILVRHRAYFLPMILPADDHFKDH
jgi:hypothetical protein